MILERWTSPVVAWPRRLLWLTAARAILVWLAIHVALLLRSGVVRLEPLVGVPVVLVTGLLARWGVSRSREGIWVQNLGGDLRVAGAVGAATALALEALTALVAP